MFNEQLPFKITNTKNIRTKHDYTEKYMTRAYYKLEPDGDIHKKGYCNISCSSCELIDNIELVIGGNMITRVHNHDNVVFEKIRQHLGIFNKNIIPLFPTNTFVPFLEKNYTEICVIFSRPVSSEIVNNLLTYDEVVISNDDIMLSAQFANSKEYSALQNNKIISELKITVPKLYYTGDDLCNTKYRSKILLNTYSLDSVKQFIIYTPNNLIKDINFYKTKLHMPNINIDINATLEKNFTTVQTNENFDDQKMHYFLNMYWDKSITDKQDNSETEQIVSIFGLGSRQLTFTNGMIAPESF